MIDTQQHKERPPVADHQDKPETQLSRAGRQSKEHFYRASTILYPNVDALEARSMPYTYGRVGNPTLNSLETAINMLEGSRKTIFVPSGLNAVATALLTVCSAGDHVLMTDSCYAPSRAFCDKTLRRFGIETTYYDPLIGSDIETLFRSNTKAVFCESPGSLTFEVQDIPAIARVAHERGASLLLDNTWASPLHFQALEHGADLSIQAVTKYIGGHADVMMGYVAANESHASRLLDFHDKSGLYVSGDDCFLALRGLRTLAVRLKRHEQTALTLTRWLKTKPEVDRVLFPPLEDDPGHAIWKRDFTGACGLFGIVLKPVSRRAISAMLDGLTHFGLGFSWGGYESLAVPADIRRTVSKFPAEGPVIRIHAGLEDPVDLIADLTAGLERLRAAS
jgi:cystathionine beta-lyase